MIPLQRRRRGRRRQRDAGFIVNVGSRIDHDAGEIFGEEPRTAWHVGERARWIKIVSDVDDPGFTHGLSRIRSPGDAVHHVHRGHHHKFVGLRFTLSLRTAA